LVDQNSEKNWQSKSTNLRFAQTVSHEVFGTDFWYPILGLGKGIFSRWGFLAGLGIFGTPRGFWQLGVFGGVQRIFPTPGKIGWHGRN
jgi:hypothetical protein